MTAKKLLLLFLFVGAARAEQSLADHDGHDYQLLRDLDLLQLHLRGLGPLRSRQHDDYYGGAQPDTRAAVAAHWHALQTELHNAVRIERLRTRDITLDPKFPLFREEPEGFKLSDLIGGLKGTLTKGRDVSKIVELLTSLQFHEENVWEELKSGSLSTAQAMMDRCVAVSDNFMKIFLKSEVFQTLLSLATFYADHLHSAHEHAESIFDALKKEGIEIGMEIAESAAEEIESGLPEGRHTSAKMEFLKKIGNVANATVGAIGDATYGVLTLGIGPLAGRVAQTTVKGAQHLLPRDRQVAACFLAAFAAMSESLNHEGSDPFVAQCIEYRVQSRDDLIHDAGGYSKKARYALFLNDIPEEERVAGSPTVSGVDIYEVLNEDFKAISKASNVADILRGPVSGISTTLRQYFMGNEFEQAVKFAGVSLVKFLKENFWKQILEQTKGGSIPLSQVGIVKNLVVKETTTSVRDYVDDGGRELFGCTGVLFKECWHRSTSSRSPDAAWCYTRNPWSQDPKAKISCKTKEDCNTATKGKWLSVSSWKCVTPDWMRLESDKGE
eukprot:c13048_g1_i1.p1 GENE.c13048_g1_i1~~c13048_g1_i1.p1  ORF type:complete len:555 (+),score=111.93 c13048_g1_i1:22-1686(+)